MVLCDEKRYVTPQVDEMADLSTEMERRLGAIVRKKFATDFYILHKYPLEVPNPFFGLNLKFIFFWVTCTQYLSNLPLCPPQLICKGSVELMVFNIMHAGAPQVSGLAVQ